MRAQSQTNIKSETQTNSTNIDTQPPIQIDTQPQPHINTKPELQLGTPQSAQTAPEPLKPQINVSSHPPTNINAQPPILIKTKPQPHTDTKPEILLNSQQSMQTAPEPPKPGEDINLDPPTNTDAQPPTQTGTQPQPHVGTKPGIQLDSQQSIQTVPKPPKPQIDISSHPPTNINIQPPIHIDTRPQPQTHTKPETQLNSQQSIQTAPEPRKLEIDIKSPPPKRYQYKQADYIDQLQERGSFMDDHATGITTQSKELLAKLLQSSREPPQNTLFLNNTLFRKTCINLRGAIKTKIILRISELIFPSAEVLADRGISHLEILRETTNTLWNHAIPFYRSYPKPDFGLRFKREAFTQEQLEKLQPYISPKSRNRSYIAATDNIYLPFFTSKVKSRMSALDIADRQNLHNQTVSLSNLVKLFQTTGRLDKLDREVNGFSISHNNKDVRI